MWNDLRDKQLSLDPQIVREGLRVLTQALMDIEVCTLIDADPFERNDSRVAYRNGYRTRTWRTHAGELTLRVPKLRKGTYSPAFLHRRHVERTLTEFVTRAVLVGVEVADVDQLLAELDIVPPHTSKIYDLIDALAQTAERFQQSVLDDAYASLLFDVMPLERGASVVLVIGVDERGTSTLLAARRIRSLHADDFWLDLLRDLRRRGLQDVRQVISDAHDGVRDAVRRVYPGAAWHYLHALALEDILMDVPDAEQSPVVAAMATIFLNGSPVSAQAQLRRVVTDLHSQFPAAALPLAAWGSAMLADPNFSAAAWFESAGVMARLNQALTRQADAIGIPLGLPHHEHSEL